MVRVLPIQIVKWNPLSERNMFLSISDEGPSLETFEIITISISSTPTFLYFYLYLYLNTACAAHYILVHCKFNK